MPYEWDFGTLLQYRWLILWGALVTIGFTLATVVAGMLVGLVVALGRMTGRRWISIPLLGLVEAFRCTPVLVQLVWIYYALPVLIGVEMSPSTASIITLSFYGGSYYAEIIRGGVASIETGQWDAAHALGLRTWPLLRLVILPQAVKRMIPPLVNQTILQLKNTALVSVIAVPDLLYQGQQITSATYRPLETYTVVAVAYFILLFPLTRLAMWVERRVKRSER